MSNPLLPPLRRIHSDQMLEQARGKTTLAFWRGQATEVIVASLRPGQFESLKVKPDGRVMNGNTRIKVLEERGYDLATLPRELVP